jgi:hypothetical protein
MERIVVGSEPQHAVVALLSDRRFQTDTTSRTPVYMQIVPNMWWIFDFEKKKKSI